MSRIRGYKKTENNIVRYISKLVRRIVGFFFDLLRGLFACGQKKLTIMIVPHSQKKVINFQTSIFSVLFVCLMVIGVFTSFFLFAHKTLVSTQDLSALKEENQKTQASLEIGRAHV